MLGALDSNEALSTYVIRAFQVLVGSEICLSFRVVLLLWLMFYGIHSGLEGDSHLKEGGELNGRKPSVQGSHS